MKVKVHGWLKEDFFTFHGDLLLSFDVSHFAIMPYYDIFYKENIVSMVYFSRSFFS